MSNIGYRELRSLDEKGLKRLNDTLRALWKKTMGGLEYRDLAAAARGLIDGKAETGSVDAVIARLNATDDAFTIIDRQTQGLAQRVADAEGNGSILAQATAGLATRVTDTENGLSAVEQTAQSIGAAVGGLQIGGRNYLRDSEAITVADTAGNAFAYSDVYSPLANGRRYTFSAQAVEAATGDAAGATALLLDPNTQTTACAETFSIGPDPQSYTFTVPADGSWHLLLAAGIWGATALSGVVWRKAKLETGDRATDWQPCPEEFHAGSAIRMTEDIVDIATPTFRVNVNGSNGDMSLDETGLTVASINCPVVAGRYTGPAALTVDPAGAIDGEYVFASLDDALNALSGRWLETDAVVTMSADTVESEAAAYGIYGGGSVTVEGEGHALNGRLCIRDTGVRCTIRGLNVYADSEQDNAVAIDNCAYVQIEGCLLRSGGAPTLCATKGASAHVSGTELHNTATDGIAALCSYNARMTLANCTGSAHHAALAHETGGMIGLYGTRSTGLLTAVSPGQLADGSTGSSSGTTPPASTNYTTVTLAAAATAWYNDTYGGWATAGNSPCDLRQGLYYGENFGVIWFDTSALAGRTVAGAGLRIVRKQDWGRGGSIEVRLNGVTNNLRTGTPAIVRSYGLIGTCDKGTTLKCAIPAAAAQDLIDGTIKGLCLYTDESDYWAQRAHSYHYGQFCGTDGGVNAPKLTIKYT